MEVFMVSFNPMQMRYAGKEFRCLIEKIIQTAYVLNAVSISMRSFVLFANEYSLRLLFGLLKMLFYASIHLELRLHRVTLSLSVYVFKLKRPEKLSLS